MAELASTYEAEYLALTQLQADAFVTMDAKLARRVEDRHDRVDRRAGDSWGHRLSPVIGQFAGKRGSSSPAGVEGQDHPRRYVWLDLSPTAARMEQSFTDDGGKTWEVNWICELTR